MKTKFFIMTILLLLIPIFSFGMILQEEVPNVDLSDVNLLVGLATAVLTGLATQAVKKSIKVIRGVGVLISATIIAGIITALSNWMNAGDLSWGLQLIAGLASTFLYEFYKGVKSTPEISG